MITILFLDDERNPSDVTWVNWPDLDKKFVVVRNVPDFLDKFLELEPEMVSFDHDLGVTADGKIQPTGYACVKAAINLLLDNDDMKIPKALFHSKNPVGERNMRLYWKNGIKEVREIRNAE